MTTIGSAPADSAGSVLVRRWSHHARNVGAARHELRCQMEIWGLAPLAEIAELVLSELLSNSVRHARNPRGRHIETRYEKTNAAELRIEVHDANTSLPIPQKADTDAEAGRGLVLVHALTQGRWGVEERPHGIGKLVWAVCADTGAVGVSG